MKSHKRSTCAKMTQLDCIHAMASDNIKGNFNKKKYLLVTLFLDSNTNSKLLNR